MAPPCWFCCRNLIKFEGANLGEVQCHGEPDPRSGQPGSPRLRVTVKGRQGHCWQSGMKGEMRAVQRDRQMASKSRSRPNHVSALPKLLVARCFYTEYWDSSRYKGAEPFQAMPKRRNRFLQQLKCMFSVILTWPMGKKLTGHLPLIGISSASWHFVMKGSGFAWFGQTHWPSSLLAWTIINETINFTTESQWHLALPMWGIYPSLK